MESEFDSITQQRMEEKAKEERLLDLLEEWQKRESGAVESG